MISRMLGAPGGGSTLGGQYGLESGALRPISPPNFGGGFGRYFPSIVVVALGEPGAPVVCCARAVVANANSEQAVASPFSERSFDGGRSGSLIMVSLHVGCTYSQSILCVALRLNDNSTPRDIGRRSRCNSSGWVP